MHASSILRSPASALGFVAAISAFPTGAQVQAPTPVAGPASAVAVIVKVPKPWYAPRALVASRMRDTIPQYESLPGLAFKAFSFAQADGQYGGVYLWKDLASAQAWFSPQWHARVERERGSKGEVRFFDVALVLDNVPGGTPASNTSDAAVTLVTIPVPAGVSPERLRAEFQAAVPTYQKVPGLLRKYFITTADGRFGGIYLWANAGSAQQWFGDAWHARVRGSYGTDASIEWFDTPILLPSKLAGNRVAAVAP